MERYPCKSNLDLKLDLLVLRLQVKSQHNYHPEYNDIRLSPEALEYVNTHCADHIPAEIFNNLQPSGISGGSKVAQHQVYDHWQRANSSIWRRDLNQFVSSTNLSAEFESKFWHAIYKAGNLRGLAFFIRGTIMALASRAEELVIDATFGTNNSGMSLSAVLAGLDGTGVPLCYLFLGIDSSSLSNSATPGATITILRQFLQPLKDAGYNPSFFGCDKDKAEISAIQYVWPNATIQLCLCHAKRAIRKKLKDSGRTNTQKHYSLLQAKIFVPSLEVCWGSNPTNQPGDYRYSRCQCTSTSVEFDQLGRPEAPSVSDQEIVLQMFSRHYNMHTMIADQSALDDIANDTDSKTDIWEEEPEYMNEESDEAEELDDSDDENLLDYSERLQTLFDDLKDLVHEQKGNTEFLKRFAEGNLRNFTLLDGIKHLKAQRSMAKKWSSRKHSELLFYRRKC
ncbi:hypothetical protein K3495_g8838 [Podosphaera aphanis]|nr:hypothetical protein K3495_g8838 [Podosphaera aphanis]